MSFYMFGGHEAATALAQVFTSEKLHASRANLSVDRNTEMRGNEAVCTTLKAFFNSVGLREAIRMGLRSGCVQELAVAPTVQATVYSGIYKGGGALSFH